MKKQILLSSIFLCVFAHGSFAQQFQKIIGGTAADQSYSVRQTTDHGYIIAATTENYGAGGSDAYLIKTDSVGDTLWTRTFGGFAYDYGSTAIQTTDGGYMLIGFATGIGGSSSEILLVKTNATGTMTWSKTYGGQFPDLGLCIAQTSDGGYIVSGSTLSFGAGYNDVYLLKTDSTGSLTWKKVFGGSGNEQGVSVRQTTDGGYIVCGYTDSYGAGSSDVYVIKTAANGSLQWSKTYGGSGAEVGNEIQQTTDHGYIIAGTTSSYGAGLDDAYLIKTDSSGNVSWKKVFGGSKADGAYSVQQTSDGGYILTGYATNFSASSTEVCLIKTKPTGDTLWTKYFGGSDDDQGKSVRATADGGYIVVGNTHSFGSGTTGDIYLIKTDASGSSGCNDTTVVLTASNLSLTQVTVPGTTSATGGTTSTSTAQVGSGCNITTLCTTVGIGELLTDNLISAYPNPSSGNFHLEFADSRSKNIFIFSTLGEKVFEKRNLGEKEFDINLAQHPKGIYIVKVEDKGSVVATKLVVY